jgi:hypothetical protein
MQLVLMQIVASCVNLNLNLNFDVPPPYQKLFTYKKNDSLVLISIIAGAALIVVSLSGFLIVCLLPAKRNHGAEHNQFVKRNINLLSATARPNPGHCPNIYMMEPLPASGSPL